MTKLFDADTDIDIDILRVFRNRGDSCVNVQMYFSSFSFSCFFLFLYSLFVHFFVLKA